MAEQTFISEQTFTSYGHNLFNWGKWYFIPTHYNIFELAYINWYIPSVCAYLFHLLSPLMTHSLLLAKLLMSAAIKVAQKLIYSKEQYRWNSRTVYILHQ